MAVLWFLCLLAMTVAGQTQIPDDNTGCPADFVKFGDSCYAYMQGKQPWAGAEQICEVLHGHLVEMFTKEELSFIQNLTEAHGSDDVWLGGHDLLIEGHWIWAWSGSNMEMTAWADGQPNDGDHGREDCLELNEHSHLWNDEDCRHEKHYICQISVNGEGTIG